MEVWDKNRNKNIANKFKSRDGTVLEKRAITRMKDFIEYKMNLPFDHQKSLPY